MITPIDSKGTRVHFQAHPKVTSILTEVVDETPANAVDLKDIIVEATAQIGNKFFLNIRHRYESTFSSVLRSYQLTFVLKRNPLVYEVYVKSVPSRHSPDKIIREVQETLEIDLRKCEAPCNVKIFFMDDYDEYTAKLREW